MKSELPSKDDCERWDILVQRISRHQHREEWDEAREGVRRAAAVAATEGERRFTSFLEHAIDFQSLADLSPEQEFALIERALDDLNAIPDCGDEDTDLPLESLRAQFRWLLVMSANALGIIPSTEEFEKLSRETGVCMVDARTKWARRRLDQEDKLADLPTWQRTMAEHGIVGMLRLKELHEHDPEILKRPAEIIKIIQEEASLSIWAVHGSYEAMLRSGLDTPAEREAFRVDFQQRLDAWRLRPFARDVEQLFQTCWSRGISAADQESIRKKLNDTFCEALVGLVPTFTEYECARKPEARGRAGIQLLAETVEAVYQPILCALLDMSKHAIGRPQSTEGMSVGTMINAAKAVWSTIVPGLEPAANPTLVIARNAAMHRHFEVTPDGQITLWGKSRGDLSKTLGPIDMRSLDALIDEARELCLTLFNAFNLLLHPDQPHLGR